VVNLRDKFEVSRFNRSRDIARAPNSKSRSGGQFTKPFDLILHFSLTSFVASLSAKFEVSSFNRSPDIYRGSKTLQVGHVTDSPSPLT